MSVVWNANGLSMLTAHDRDCIEHGINPGDDGSGRKFVAENDRITVQWPSDFDPHGVCRLTGEEDDPYVHDVEIADDDDEDERDVVTEVKPKPER